MVNFENTEYAFAHKTNGELKQAAFLFKTLANSSLTKVGITLTNFALKIGLPIKGIIKKTLYQQFVGGETLEEASVTAQKIFAHGVGVILDYGVEGNITEEQFDKAAQEFIEAIEFAAGKKHIPFISIKVTGFARFSLLEKIDAGETLSFDEENELAKVKKRLNAICDAAAKGNVLLLIDAEETWIQDPVDALALEMMAVYNKERILIFNTYQMYRHDRLAFLKNSHEKSRTEKFILGTKLVRGAYMEKERARAAAMNYLDPIQPNKEACDRDFDAAVTYCLDHIEEIAVFIGTHNDNSCLQATLQMKERNIPITSKHVYFSQLFGMSDNISFNLAHEGYNISKYLPYGEVKEVVPYLMRRAQENTSVKGQTGRELNLITKELKRRKLS